MERRLQFQQVLEDLLGTRNVYFQAPVNLKIQYPCIIFEVNDVDTIYANNLPYRRVKRYEVTIIDPDPDSDIPDKVALLPLAAFNRAYTADNLNHTVYNVYF
jgi:hypothetical protein